MIIEARLTEILDEHGCPPTRAELQELGAEYRRRAEPIPMRIVCPECKELHIDEVAFKTKPHHTHACQRCGNVWRPAIEHTVGVRFLPGLKNENG